MNTPYLLFPIAILSVLLYFLSLILVKFGIIYQSLHRKIWNTVLLSVFLSTVILGLLLAIQVNYKFEWTFVKTALVWHVNFGIGLSIVAIFHLTWHLNYYLKIFKPNDVTELEQKSSLHLSNQKLKPLIFLSGFIAMVVQVLMFRELTTVFEGNELMMSWMLGVWMLLTGLGALLGRQKRILQNAEKLLSSTLFSLSVVPLVIVVLINLLKNEIFPIGVLVSPANFLIILFVVLSPICLIIGIIYSLLIDQFRSNHRDFIKVYAFESVGSLVGGLVVSFLFIQWLSIIQSLLVLSIVASIFLFFIFKRMTHLLLLILMLMLLTLFLIFPLDNWIKSYLFVNQKVIESRETYYGNLTITESANQYNFFSNGSLLFTTDNTIVNEETVHYAMLQSHKPEKILLVSGGISGMVDEILKYSSVNCIDYVELNPRVVSIGEKYKPLSADSRVHFYAIDGRRYIQHVNKKYDVAIFAIPDPSSLQINRLYTDEFIKILKDKLSLGAVAIFGLVPAGNYISPIKASIESSVYQTLKNSFKHVEVIPGEKDYLLASDSSINLKISEISAVCGVENKFVNPYYIDDFSIQQRGASIKKSIERINLINTDTKPIPVFYETMQFVSLYESSSWLVIAIPIVLLLIPLFFLGPIPKGMYIAGFSAASIEIMLIFSFQVIFGYVYSAIGLIIAVFMGGLAFGSLLGYRFKITQKHYLLSQSALGIYVLIFPFIWYLQSKIAYSIPNLIIFFALTFIPSTLVGFQYVTGILIMTKDVTKAATSLYSADLIGSALGVVVTTILLLPLVGLTWCCFVIAGFNLVGVILTLSAGGSIFRTINNE